MCARDRRESDTMPSLRKPDPSPMIMTAAMTVLEVGLYHWPLYAVDGSAVPCYCAGDPQGGVHDQELKMPPRRRSRLLRTAAPTWGTVVSPTVAAVLESQCLGVILHYAVTCTHDVRNLSLVSRSFATELRRAADRIITAAGLASYFSSKDQTSAVLASLRRLIFPPTGLVETIAECLTESADDESWGIEHQGMAFGLGRITFFFMQTFFYATCDIRANSNALYLLDPSEASPWCPGSHSSLPFTELCSFSSGGSDKVFQQLHVSAWSHARELLHRELPCLSCLEDRSLLLLLLYAAMCPFHANMEGLLPRAFEGYEDLHLLPGMPNSPSPGRPVDTEEPAGRLHPGWSTGVRDATLLTSDSGGTDLPFYYPDGGCEHVMGVVPGEAEVDVIREGLERRLRAVLSFHARGVHQAAA